MTLRPAALAVAAALSVLAAPSNSAAPAQPIAVVLSNFDFAPSTIAMVHGRAYAMTLSNTASGGHNFAAPAFFAAARIDPADRARVAEGTVEVPAGQSVTIHLTPPAAGRYKVRCTHAFHTMFGMKGAIVVS
jgi:uncharacterized cupredoxin-like copper-binding protein